MTAIRFTVLGAPVPQPRQRHRHVQTKDGREFTMNYAGRTDPVQQFKADIKAAAQAAGLPAAMWDRPVVLECVFYLPRPAKYMRRRDPEGPVPHIAKPDLDNLVKAVKDALKGVLWPDDSRVCLVRAVKLCHEKGGRPRTEVCAWAMVEGFDWSGVGQLAPDADPNGDVASRLRWAAKHRAGA